MVWLCLHVPSFVVAIWSTCVVLVFMNGIHTCYQPAVRINYYSDTSGQGVNVLVANVADVRHGCSGRSERCTW